MDTLEQWQQAQRRLERCFYLVLDADGQLGTRDALVGELEPECQRNLYAGTPAHELAEAAPYLFRLENLEHPVLRQLLETPDLHWGWLASAACISLDRLVAHWHACLVSGEEGQQALHRFHDNRVLGRVLAGLSSERQAAYLGPLSSVCYWQAGQWVVIDNLGAGEPPLAFDPDWLKLPEPDATLAGTQFDNAHRYLMRDYVEHLARLARHGDVNAWLRDRIDWARAWGWREPAHLYFLLTQSLQRSLTAWPAAWLPQPHETPEQHFERVYREIQYWQGEGNL
ncbi:MAG: hypothetical protein GAK37_02834 [Pseudomonas sp.]|nr:MAG: hypothetical protein GAK37_02834 [Pseudomonas sp.]